MNHTRPEGVLPDNEGSIHARQYNLDLLKALAIVCMLFCHPIIRFGEYRPGYKSEFLYFLADDIIGDYIVAAHGFMFAMGVHRGRRDLFDNPGFFVLPGHIAICRTGFYRHRSFHEVETERDPDSGYQRDTLGDRRNGGIL